MGSTKEAYINALEWHRRPTEFEECPICFTKPGAPIREGKEIVHRIDEYGITYWKHGRWINGLFLAIYKLKLKRAVL